MVRNVLCWVGTAQTHSFYMIVNRKFSVEMFPWHLLILAYIPQIPPVSLGHFCNSLAVYNALQTHQNSPLCSNDMSLHAYKLSMVSWWAWSREKLLPSVQIFPDILSSAEMKKTPVPSANVSGQCMRIKKTNSVRKGKFMWRNSHRILIKSVLH